MASQAIATYRQNAEVFQGDAICKEKIMELLKDLCLPLGLLPLEDVEELGYNRDAGFFWVTQKKKREHTFKKAKQQVSYATEVSGFVEKYRMKKLTGVKTKELFIWLSITEVYIDEPSSGKITFKTGTGLSESFPVSAFDPEA